MRYNSTQSTTLDYLLPRHKSGFIGSTHPTRRSQHYPTILCPHRCRIQFRSLSLTITTGSFLGGSSLSSSFGRSTITTRIFLGSSRDSTRCSSKTLSADHRGGMFEDFRCNLINYRADRSAIFSDLRLREFQINVLLLGLCL